MGFLWNSRFAGSVRVELPAAPALVTPPDAAADLQRLDTHFRLELPAQAPPLHPPAALHAAAIIYRCCQLLTYRQLGEEWIAPLLTRMPGDNTTPAAAYSVDLALAALPDLYRLAHAISPQDPLTQALLQLGRAWPLSGVGIAELDAQGAWDLRGLWPNPCLRQLYLDRVIACRAYGRLDDPQLRAALAATLGGYPELAPDLASRLPQQETPPHAA